MLSKNVINNKSMAEKKLRLFTVPNIITLGNLACGTAAVVVALRFNDLRAAFWLVVAAAVLDFLDGFVARITKQYSEVGKQLDSLCDMVSFGLAPSAVLYSMYAAAGGAEPWGYAVFAVVLFSALRLAKFNVDESQSDSFVGLPTPACALFVVSAGWLFASGAFSVRPEFIIAIALVLSYLLISHIRMFALKFHDFTLRNNVIRYCFLILSAASIIVFQIAAIPFIITAYVLISFISGLICLNHSKSEHKGETSIN